MSTHTHTKRKLQASITGKYRCTNPQQNSTKPHPALGFSGGSAGKASACSIGDLGLIPGMERSPGEGNSYPLQYSTLENSMDCTVCRVTKSWTLLSNLHFQGTQWQNLLISFLGIREKLYCSLKRWLWQNSETICQIN